MPKHRGTQGGDAARIRAAMDQLLGHGCNGSTIDPSGPRYHAGDAAHSSRTMLLLLIAITWNK